MVRVDSIIKQLRKYDSMSLENEPSANSKVKAFQMGHNDDPYKSIPHLQIVDQYSLKFY